MTANNTSSDKGKRTRRLIALCIVGVITVLLAVTYRHYRYARPVGSGPAGPTVPLEPFSKPWTTRKVVVLGLGDSVTQGLGSSTTSKCYFNRLVKNPKDDFPDIRGRSLTEVFPNLDVLNLAISGTTSIECVDYQLPKLKPYDEAVFGVVVMTTGGNDVIHNYGRTPPREGAMFGAKLSEIGDWVINYGNRLDTILTRIRETFPGGCHVFIANIYDPTDDDGDIVNAGLPAWPEGLSVLKAYNDVIAGFDEKHDDVSLIDMRAGFLGHGIHCTHFWHRHYQSADPHYWYWENLEDPNDRGYDALRRLFLLEMARVLPARFTEMESSATPNLPK